MQKRKIGFRTTVWLLSFVMMFSLMPVCSFAAESVASVNGNVYSSISDAWNQVKGGGTITMLSDWKTSLLEVNKNANVTVEMNGHVINRGLSNTDYYGYGDGQIFFVNEGASLTLNGGSDTEHVGYIDGHLWFSGSKSGHQSLTLTGGVLTGGACDDSDGAGAITMKRSSTVTLNHVNIAGNLADCYAGSYGHAGAVRMYPSGTLYMNHSKILYNHAESNGGGVYVTSGADNADINLTDSEISNNYAVGDGGGIYSDVSKAVVRMTDNSKIDSNSAQEGGGIYLNYSKSKVRSKDITGSISNNIARDDHGGGIYLCQNMTATNSGSIHGISLESNSAADFGGAIYLDQESINVSSCTIVKNTAKEGAGIYNNNDLNTISDCVITDNNASTQGGGVYSSCLNDISLSGKLMIKNNTRSDGTNDDVFLGGSWASDSYLTASPSGTSEVGIRLAEPKERRISNQLQSYYANAFFYDQRDQYHFEFRADQGELWLVKGAKEDVSITEVAPETSDEGTFNDQSLIKGYFSYPSVAESTEDLSTEFYYSDGYFLNGSDGAYGDATVYNPHLATMSIVMALAGFYSNIGNDGKQTKGSDRTYTYKSQNIERLFHDIGVSEEDIFVSESNTIKPGTDTIGCAIGQKSIGTDGEILIPIAVRGAGYESEWYSNTSIGDSGEHTGFASAADQVFQLVDKYISDYGLEEAKENGKLKFWIAGYSRAGATSNLTARRLLEAYCYSDRKDDEGNRIETATGNQVYAYCIEAPKGGLNSEMKLSEEKYYCIHNCINNADLVPLVGLEEMGFIRYGVDHYIPGSSEAESVQTSSSVWSYVDNQDWVSSYKTWYDNTVWSVGSDQYNQQRSQMLSQLSSIDPVNICFYDRFRPASVEYIGSQIGLYDMINEINSTQLKQEQFNRIFLRALSTWGFYGSYNRNLRASYSNETASEEGATFQNVLQIVTKLIFSKSNEDLTGIVDALGGTLERIDDTEGISMMAIWDDCIGDWCSLSQEKRNKYAEQLWTIAIEGKGVNGDAVKDYLTESELKELSDIWYSFLDVMLRFVASDYNFNADDWNESHSMVSDSSGNYLTTPITENIGGLNKSTSQVLLGTFVHNASTILQAHYPEVNLAWLRSYDSFYDSDTGKPVSIEKQKAPVVTSSISRDGEIWEEAETAYEGDRLLKLSTDTAGAGVYYRIRTNEGEFGDWKPMNQPIELNVLDGEKTTYTLEVTAVFCGSVSDCVTLSYSVEPVVYYPVTVINGTASVEGKNIQEASGDTVVTINAGTAPEGKDFDHWTVEKGTVTFADEKNKKTTFVMPREEVVVKAVFKDKESSAETTFKDVPKDSYYYEPVYWALNRKITNGISEDLFGPDQSCTRGQMITFLFREAGSPDSNVNAAERFSDVAADEYYTDAVAWAVEKGITNGVSETEFAPDQEVTRAQAMTFLHRYQGKPVFEAKNPFIDVESGSYYFDAVRWAVDKEVTTGTSATTFEPDGDCTRAQLVTFLYRVDRTK